MMMVMVTRGCIVVVRGRGGAGVEVVVGLIVEEVVVVEEVETVGLVSGGRGGGGDALVNSDCGGEVLKVGQRIQLSPYRHILCLYNQS